MRSVAVPDPREKFRNLAEGNAHYRVGRSPSFDGPQAPSTVNPSQEILIMHRAPRPFPISSIAAFAGLALAIPAPVEGASREYTVHLQPSKFTLYTDPYTSEEILLGGFSVSSVSI